MVEVRGVEPRSEGEPTRASPSAVYGLDLALPAVINSLRFGQPVDFPLMPPDKSIRVAYFMIPLSPS